MSETFDDVQRIVLRGTRWKAARHLMLEFGVRSPLHFLDGLLNEDWPAAAAGCSAGKCAAAPVQTDDREWKTSRGGNRNLRSILVAYAAFQITEQGTH